jgi:hypothetical protein
VGSSIPGPLTTTTRPSKGVTGGWASSGLRTPVP